MAFSLKPAVIFNFCQSGWEKKLNYNALFIYPCNLKNYSEITQFYIIIAKNISLIYLFLINNQRCTQCRKHDT